MKPCPVCGKQDCNDPHRIRKVERTVPSGRTDSKEGGKNDAWLHKDVED